MSGPLNCIDVIDDSTSGKKYYIVTMERYYIIEGIFILLGLALIVAVVKYPKDAFVKLPMGIAYYTVVRPVKSILSIPILLIGLPLIYLGEKYNWSITPTIKKLLDSDTSNDDRPYPATKYLKVGFENGEKYALVISANKDLKELIRDFIEVLTGKYAIDDFRIITRESQAIIVFPKDINFYDYHLAVQHLNSELGDKKSFGFYKSDRLQYFGYQDSKTLNNLVGFTADKKLFSIHMLDALDVKQALRLNQTLKIDSAWVERWSEQLKKSG